MYPPTNARKHTTHVIPPRKLPKQPSLRNLATQFSQTASTPTSRLLFSAATVALSRTWIGHIHKGEGDAGGAGWLILSYWGGKLVIELRRGYGGRKGKGKARATGDGDGNILQSLLLAGGLALQSVSFYLTLRAAGPLRSIIIHISSTTISQMWSSPMSSSRQAVPLLPLSLAILLVIASLASSLDALALLPGIGLILATLLLDGLLPIISQTRSKSSKNRPTDSSRLFPTSTAALLSAISVTVLWHQGYISNPIPISQTGPGHLLASSIIAIISRYIPLSSISSTGTRSFSTLSSPKDRLLVLVGISVIQFFALPPVPSRIDALVVLPLTIAGVILSSPKRLNNSIHTEFPQAQYTVTPDTPRQPWSFMNALPLSWRPHLRTILLTPTSKRIFYFLLLNLAYMGVQMVYGVFTNSLGLISDAIHMLFDCLGLGVGLWASVAATWKPDGRYTYGYARVETLSGFANGCFLILISIFIIFEAIQRVVDPPEMDTHQLLLVSSIGLAINLWGMYATGGHHHHGHSHGHDHSHAHSVPVNDKKVDHRHMNGHGQHSHDHYSTGASSDMSRAPSFLGAGTRKRSSATGSDLSLTKLSSLTHPDHDHDHSECDGHSHQHHDQHVTEHSHHDHGHAHAHSHDLHDHTHSYSANTHQDQSHSHHDHDHDHQDHSHGHHDHSHHDHAHSHNMRGVFLHVLADTLGSVGVIISTILIRLTGWTGFDPIASLFIAALIMASVIPLVIDAGKVLCLDVGTPTEIDIRAALSELSTIDGLHNYGSPRFWPKCEGEIVGSIHIQLAPSPNNSDPSKYSNTPHRYSGNTIYANAERVVGRVERVLKSRIRGLSELVVQVEGSEERRFCGCMTGG